MSALLLRLLVVSLVALTACGDTGGATVGETAEDAAAADTAQAPDSSGGPDADSLSGVDVDPAGDSEVKDAGVSDVEQEVGADAPDTTDTDAVELVEDADDPSDVLEEIDEDGAPETTEDAQAETSEDATPDGDEDASIDAPTDGEPDDTPDVVEPDSSDVESSDDLYNQLVHFEEVGVGADSAPVLVSQVIQIPEAFESVEAQIAVRGDLDAFPMAFMALVVEQDGTLSQCGDLAGLPQKPNNLLDDIYRVAFPRPQNLDGGSVYYPPSPPYDFQPIPCQEAFENKTEVEIGIVAVGMYAPGVGSNQGPSACAGAGCPNDAVVHIRFVPQPDPGDPQACAEGEETPCVCPDGTYGATACEGGAWSEACACEGAGPEPGLCLEGEVALCVCPDDTPSTMTCESGEWAACQCEATGPEVPSGACDDPYPFDLGPGASEEVTIALLGTSLQEVPWPPFTSACPTSKPPFSTEYHYAMTVTEAGNISVSFEAIPEPWEITQFWIDMLGGCGVPYQCNNSWTPLEGYAEAGTYIVGLTVAPPNEIYIPEQDWWEFSITATWTEGDPPP